jgi:hypothetical protein
MPTPGAYPALIGFALLFLDAAELRSLSAEVIEQQNRAAFVDGASDVDAAGD